MTDDKFVDFVSECVMNFWRKPHTEQHGLSGNQLEIGLSPEGFTRLALQGFDLDTEAPREQRCLAWIDRKPTNAARIVAEILARVAQPRK